MHVCPGSKSESGHTHVFVPRLPHRPPWRSAADARRRCQLLEAFAPAVASLSAMPMRTGEPVAAISRLPPGQAHRRAVGTQIHPVRLRRAREGQRAAAVDDRRRVRRRTRHQQRHAQREDDPEHSPQNGATEPTLRMRGVRSVPIPAASSRAPSRQTCRWCRRASSSWSSTPRPPGCSALPCYPHCSRPPTR